MADTPEIAVVIPTCNQPEKLRGCLAALAASCEVPPFTVYVCDSSPEPAVRERVERVCREFPAVRLFFHNGQNVAAARNFCAAVAEEPLLVNVDDDVNVQPDAIGALYRRYASLSGWRVVGGSVFWGTFWEGPKVVRRIGYARRPPRRAAQLSDRGLFSLPEAARRVVPLERTDSLRRRHLHGRAVAQSRRPHRP